MPQHTTAHASSSWGLHRPTSHFNYFLKGQLWLFELQHHMRLLDSAHWQQRHQLQTCRYCSTTLSICGLETVCPACLCKLEAQVVQVGQVQIKGPECSDVVGADAAQLRGVGSRELEGCKGLVGQVQLLQGRQLQGTTRIAGTTAKATNTA